MRQELLDELRASIRNDMPLILAGKDPYQKDTALPLKTIVEAVAKATNVNKRNIAGPRRYAPYVRARQIFFHLASEFSDRTPIEIGAFLNRDQSTMRASVHRATYLLPCDSRLRSAYERTRKILNV